MFDAELFGVFFFQHGTVFFIKLKQLFFIHTGHHATACKHSSMPAFAGKGDFCNKSF